MKHLVTLVLTLNVIFVLIKISSALSPPKSRECLTNFESSDQHSKHEELGSTSRSGPASPREPSRERERSPGRYSHSDDVKPAFMKITDWVPDDAWYADRSGFHQIREGDGIRVFEAGKFVIGRIAGRYIAPIYTRDHKFLILNKQSKRRWAYDDIEEVQKRGVGRQWLPYLEKAHRDYEKRLLEAAEKQRDRNNDKRKS